MVIGSRATLKRRKALVGNRLGKDDGNVMYDGHSVSEVSRVIKALSCQYLGSGLALEDLEQSGWLGFLEQMKVKPFDARNGVPWPVYVTMTAAWGILRELDDEYRQRSYPERGEEAVMENGRRRRKKRRALGQNDPPGPLPTPTADEGDQIDLQGAMEGLDERERQAVELTFWQCLKQQEAARVMGISQPAFNKLLQRTLEKIRVALEPDGQRRRDRVPTLK